MNMEEAVYLIGDYAVIETDGHPGLYDVLCAGIDRILGRGSYRDMILFATMLAE